MPNKVVVYTSPTCGPCKRLKPELLKQAEERGFELEIVELSDANRPRFAQHGIRAVPVTMLVDESGEEVARFSGQPKLSVIEETLNDWKL